MEVLCDKNGEHGLRVAVVSTTGVLRVGSVNAPFTLNPGEDLHLRVFVDKNLVEVFANDRQAAVAARKYARDNTGVTLFSEGGESVVQKAHSWNLKSIYTKP